MKSQPIYVEITIRGSLDDVWRLTQTPQLHEQWDLRFSEIRYLPRPDLKLPQRFLYATRIGFGLRIEGEGESVGEHAAGGSRTSALKFWSRDPRSMIREGSGYWKYVPCAAGVRFLTRYDYRTRFGIAGRLLDRLVFRPLLGWATAWSFDRLRLWIERGIDPAVSMQRGIIHAICRVTLALIWLYQGIVPKLLFRSMSGELETVRAAGLFRGIESNVLTAAAIVEIALGLLTLMLWRARALLSIQIILLLLLAAAAAVSDASLFAGQFNPATLNLAMIALALVGLLASRDLPTASSCLRRESGAAS